MAISVHGLEMNDDRIYNVSSVEEAEYMYKQLCLEEEQATKTLDGLVSQRTELESKITKIHKILPTFQLVYGDAEQLANMISFTSTLAENISSKVRQLDLAKSRVTECVQRVEDILDLKFCTDGVQTALQNEDYEQAAAHIHRFLSLDESVLKRSTADTQEGSSMEEAFSSLREAKNRLRHIVMKKFKEAVNEGDIASVERFFKIFPLLNQHDEGLHKFSLYLSSQISETAHKNLKQAQATSSTDKRANVIYADTVTLLFEGIARTIEIHQPLVETYYGHGRLHTVVELLQKECDCQVKKILEDFKKNRQFKKRAQQVQAHLRSSKQTEKLDPRDLDVLLAEVALLNSRAELYLRFIRRRVASDFDVAYQDPTVKSEKVQQFDRKIKESDLCKSMQEIVSTYIIMEEYFLIESVRKAIEVDTIEENSQCSSMLDDVFFILKKCLKRAFSSGSVDGVCAMLNHSCALLETDFANELSERLKMGFPPSGILDLSQAYSMIQSSFQQGRIQPAETVEKARALFVTTLNNVEMAREYTKTLASSLQEDLPKSFASATEQETAKLESCLTDLNNSSLKFQSLLSYGVAELCNAAIKPHVKSWADTFQSTDHSLTEDDFTSYEANDGIRPFLQTFIVTLDGALKAFKGDLIPANYDSLVNLTAAETTFQLEKAVFKCSFNRLGGLQFDKELRYLISYMTSVTTWSIRDKFSRVSQISTLLNMEMVSEILDIWGTNAGPMTWRLTPTEVRQVLSLRNDFRQEDIRRLKL
ncbi:conserved oligomeric Golgi complex subunit 4 isoform X5 [Dermacentor silvarum]|uniref:conserved oligomeric Golgi complex subunit 4 isoform X4 n=1 Tax=Dermacentor silvarum TaxID=543639 RepID=UPI001897866F|nr:conserved oligomeric Golgi complex subunit 4 isoform X4 [Dermacentor silvarum]XP_049524753.1 conserved oligomeric Golgi complex subunit 4 isoform X5 [Dermacentor silvarum]